MVRFDILYRTHKIMTEKKIRKFLPENAEMQKFEFDIDKVTRIYALRRSKAKNW